MISLDDLRFVDALSRSGSLSAAARSLNVTPPAVSMRLKKLERSLGINLVVRSSRRVRFTGEGEYLVAEAQSLLGRINALPEALSGEGQTLAGRLRVVASFGFGRIHVAPLIAQFAKAHPSVHVTLDLSEKPWTDSKDADVVIHIGAVRDSSWVAHLLARNARWVCASPAYLRRHGVPAQPRELLQHACLCVRENDEDVTLWRYRKSSKTRAARGRADAVRVTPTLTSNDGEVVRNWALAGLGVVLRSQWDVAPFVKRGELQRIVTGWDFDGADILALVPARRGISARVTRFVDFLKGALHRKPPWR
ncbi:MAG: LysR family transcriptional regulator [Rhizobiales bacterium]|nr:LysR family transcriptional regulator [Hyphomicrobiales bacterium]